ncbi:MAG: hypothetical protein Rubg2KO_37740 [Rubricoccaceae bacterium]
MSAPLRLSVTGVGLACSLGLNAPDACAAAFAGLTRPGPMPGIDVFDSEEAVGVDLNVHAVPLLTEGFVDVARFARLGTAALADLMSRSEILDDGKTGICIALPSFYHLRRHEEAQAIADDEPPPPEPYALEADIRTEALRTQLVPTIRRFSDVSLHPSPGVTLFEGKAGFGSLLLSAARALQGGAISRCLVGGIDSFLDPLRVRALEQAGILLTPDNAAGAMPGEAAAFLLVERAREDSASPTLEGIELAQDVPFAPILNEPSEDAELPEPPPRPAGIGLANCLGTTRAAGLAEIETLYTSLNGATHRAFDWGCAQVRLSAASPFEPETVHPAMFFGDTGAATGPLAVCLADHARQRGWGSSSGVWLASDSGLRSSFRFSS